MLFITYVSTYLSRTFWLHFRLGIGRPRATKFAKQKPRGVTVLCVGRPLDIPIEKDRIEAKELGIYPVENYGKIILFLLGRFTTFMVLFNSDL